MRRTWFEIDLEPGAGTPGAVGGVELEYLCLRVEDVALGDAAHEAVAGVLHFAPETQDAECTEDAFPVRADLAGQVAGSQVEVAQLPPGRVPVEGGAGPDGPVRPYIRPLEIVQ